MRESNCDGKAERHRSSYRYYGWYSTRSRARRRERSADAETKERKATEAPPPHVRERRRRWAELLRLVFEVDPLECECGGRLRFVSFITREQKDVLVKILDHVGEPSAPTARGPPKWYQLVLAEQHVEANRHVYGFDDGHDDYDPDAAWSSGEWDAA